MIVEVLLKLILAPFFFLLLTPLALVVRLCGIDVLKKNLHKNERTYWQSVEQQSGASIHADPDNRSDPS